MANYIFLVEDDDKIKGELKTNPAKYSKAIENRIAR